MKEKLISAILGAVISLPMYAQIPFVQYEPVPNYQVNSQGLLEPIQGNPFMHSNSQQKKSQSTYPVIGAYCIDSNNNLKRIKIQVNGESNQFGTLSVYLRGTYNSAYSMWNPCNTRATKVERYIDGEFLSNNFEWKADSYTYGTIYFNY